MDALFVWIPKNAGTSILRSIHNLRLKRRFKRFDNKGMVTFGHVDINYLLKNGYVTEEFFNKAFKFAFVRNPWDRFVSLYFYRKTLREEKRTFEEFCDFALDCSPIGAYNEKGLCQANCQVDWIMRNGEVFVDFVGRCENIQTDFSYVCDNLGIECSLEYINRTKHKHYREYYNDETRKKITKKYEKDIDMFKYTF